MIQQTLTEKAVFDLLRSKNKKIVDDFLRVLCITYDRDLEIYCDSLVKYQDRTGKTDGEIEEKIASIAKTLKMLAFLRKNIKLLLQSPL